MDQIDVAIPCYNYARFLHSCVDSVLTQENVAVRVLVIDDASSDDTAAVGSDLARHDARVTFRRHAANLGNIATYNEGIDWASAEYFLLLSADDMLLPGALGRATAALRSHPEAVLCHGNARVIYEGRTLPSMTVHRDQGGLQRHSGEQFREFACRESASNPVWTPTAVVRTSAQKKVGGYNSRLPHSGDLELWLRLAGVGSILKVRSDQALYRRHDSNMHYLYHGVRNLREHLHAFESALGPLRDTDPSFVGLEKSYRRGLALGAIRVANHAINERDEAACEEAIVLMDEMDSSVRNTVAWAKMRVRRALSGRTLRILRSAARAVRRNRSQANC